MSADLGAISRRIASLEPDQRRSFLQKLAARNIDVASLPIAPYPRRGGPLAASWAQSRLWFLWRLDPDSAAHNVSTAVRLRGRLDRAALAETFAALVRRHEALRTTFQLADGETETGHGGVLQQLQVDLPIVIRETSVAQLADGERERAARESCRAEALAPFDLEAGPLLRVALIELGQDDHVLVVALHHIVADGWSMNLIINEFGLLYAAFVQGRQPHLPALPIQYADYALWQRDWLEAGEAERQLAYWVERLGTARAPLGLPTDRPRPTVQSSRGGNQSIELGDDLTRELRALAERRHATLAMVLMGAFQVLLFRYTEQPDVRVGMTVAGRNRLEVEGLVGPFLNTLVLRSDAHPALGFEQFLERVRTAVLEAQAHQDLPFEQLVDALRPERSLGHNPLFQVAYNHHWRTEAGAKELPGLQLEGVPRDVEVTQLDLLLHSVEAAGRVRLTLSYSADLFDAGTIARMGAQLRRLLQSIVAAPARPLRELEFESSDPAELAESSCAGLGLGVEATVGAAPATLEVAERVVGSGFLAAFLEAALRHPDRVAAACNGESLSYEQLRHSAWGVARALRDAGVGVEDCVAVLAERGLELLELSLGVWLAGAVYVPLDPRHPPARASEVLRLCRARVICTTPALEAGANAALAALPSGHRPQILRWRTQPQCAGAAPVSAFHGLALAYVIYTSGSTGTPKGAMVHHAGMNNHLASKLNWLALSSEDVLAQTASQVFDISIWQLLAALPVGGRVEIVPDELAHDALELAEHVVRTGVSVLETVPSQVRALLGAPPLALRGLRVLMSTGEELPPDLARQWHERYPSIPLDNAYGPTECSDDVAMHRVRPGREAEGARIPIGGAIQNTSLYVLSRELTGMPRGAHGELCVGGTGVGRGYLGAAAQTADVFVPDPFSAVPGARMYRTGDLARLAAGAVIDYLGRRDHQVKVRGHRIELGEIESRLRQLGSVREAVVVTRAGPLGVQLVGYVAAAGAGDQLGAELRERLCEVLPDYMVPAQLVVLEKLPLSANGKLDRKALPEPVWQGQKERIAPRTACEAELALIWCTLLRLEQVGVEDNFFELGGDSIISLQVVRRARAAGWRIQPRDIFQHQTIAALAGVAERAGELQEPRGSEPELEPEVGLAPTRARFFESASWRAGPQAEWRCLSSSPEVDLRRLDQAFCAVVARHDAFDLRFQRAATCQWVQRRAQHEPGELWSRAAADEAALLALVEEADRSLDVTRGPLARALSIELPSGERRLWIGLHRLIVDDLSWQIFVSDLEDAYAAIERDGAVAPGPRASTYSSWCARLVEEVSPQAVVRELEPALAVAEQPERALEYVELDPRETAALLQSAPAAFRATADDLLLTALARALCRQRAESSVWIEAESESARAAFSTLDLRRTLGCFRSVAPVCVTPTPGQGGLALASALKAVKEQLRHLPPGGLQRAPTTQVQYHALRPALVTRTAWFAAVPGSEGASEREPSGAASALVFGCDTTSGLARLSCSYTPAAADASAVAELLRCYRDELRSLIEHCSDGSISGLTPSDFPTIEISQQELDQLPFPPRAIEDIYAASPLQRGLAFHAVYQSESGLYVNQLCADVEGLDRGRFEAAWRAAADRHAILRTSFAALDEGAAFMQVVHRQVQLPLRELDTPAAGATPADLASLAEQERALGFELERAPLYRLLLVRTGAGRHRLIWTYHHLLLDGWSSARLIEEVLAHYLGRPLAEAGRFRDYIEWLCRKDGHASERFWRPRLSLLEGATELAASLAPGSVGAPRAGAGTLSVFVEAERTRRLVAFAREQRVTLNTLVQAAWLLLLSRHTGQATVCFGATVSGRPDDLPGAERLLGLFINTLPVIARPSPGRKLGPWLRELQAQNAELREYEYTPLYDIQRWAGRAGQGLFDSIVAFENFPIDHALREQSGEQLRFANIQASQRTNYALALIVTASEQLNLRFEYQSAAFEAAAVQAVAQRFEHILWAFAQSAELQLAQLAVATPDERSQLSRWNATEAHYPGEPGLHDCMASQARSAPDAIAVVFEGSSLSYAELDRRADRLARWLCARGIGPESLVGVCIERSLEMVVAILGILKAGAAYVPLDPEYPRERIGAMLDDARVELLLTQASLRGALPATGASVVCIDSDWGSMLAIESASGPRAVRADNLAYCIFTSGSTGRPKGSANTHAGFANRIRWMQDRYGLSREDRVLQKTPLSFDVSVWEWSWPLLVGATLVVAAPGAHRDPLLLALTIQRQAVTTLHFVPSMLQAFVASGELPACNTLRRVMSSGEALPAELARAFFAGSSAELHNLYGPTEAAVDVTAWQCERQHTGVAVPIGRPIANVVMHVLDAALEPLPMGVQGELYLAGVCLSRGYQHRPGLTAERFVPNPFGVPGERMYRSGDLGRWRGDGALEYGGRGDQQVKIRGNRIELGEVEARLREHAWVAEAAVVARGSLDERSLVGYVVLSAAGRPEEIARVLRQDLGRQLPEHMLLSDVVVLRELPLTASGKLDRKALPAPERVAAASVAPRSSLEEGLAQIWRDALQLERVGIRDDFFDLGGHSLLAVRVVREIGRIVGGNVPVSLLFQARTIEALQQALIRWLKSGDVRTLTLLQPGDESRPPLYCLHYAGGNVAGYRALARSFNGSRPIYGLQSRLFSTDYHVDASIAEMAEYYAEVITSARPGIRVNLLGWSSGGRLAWETARQLRRRGLQVSFLGLVDAQSLLAGAPAVAEATDEAPVPAVHELGDALAWLGTAQFARQWRRLAELANDEAKCVLIRAYREQGGAGRAGDVVSEWAMLSAAQELLLNCADRVEPLDVSAHAWWAAATARVTPSSSAGLPSLLDGIDAVSRVIEGDHMSVIDSPELHEQLQRALGEADAEAESGASDAASVKGAAQ